MIISNLIPDIGRIRFLTVPNYKTKWQPYTVLNSIPDNEFDVMDFTEEALLWLEIELDERLLGFIKLQKSEKEKQADCLWFIDEKFQWIGVEQKIIESMVDYLMTIETMTQLNFTTLKKITDNLSITKNLKMTNLAADIFEFSITLDQKKSARHW